MVYITGDVTATIVGLHIVGGDAAGMDGGGIVDYWDTGGGVYAMTATVVISNCQIVSNTAQSAAGIYLSSSGTSVLHANVVLHNSAYSYAGGVGLENSPEVTLDGNTIRDNSASSGGGLYADNSNDAVLSGNTILENGGWYHGGGIYVHDSTGISLSNNMVLSNTVVDPWLVTRVKGGGISLVSCPTATLEGNVIAGNTAIGDPLCFPHFGGGVYVKDSDGAVLSENIIEGNQVPGMLDSGGGLSIWDSKDIVVAGNIISANTAPSGGGGLHIHGGSGITVSHNHIVGNTSLLPGAPTIIGNGGGVGIFDVSDIMFRNNTIYGNSAGDEAGGVALQYTERAELQNTIIVDNWARRRGSGIAVFSSTVSMSHSTLANNHGGDGSGILVDMHPSGDTSYASAVAISNTILVSHTVGLTVAQGNRVTLDGVLWYGNGDNLDGAGQVTVTHALTGHPAFVDPEAHDYHIGPTSAAIDAGVGTGVSTDIDGQARDPWPDLGADEAMDKALNGWLVYLPVVAR